MRKLCILLCLIICLSTLSGCFSLLPTPQTDDKSTSGSDKTDTSSQVELGSDKEIVLKANHPKYLDDAQVATSVWKNEIDAKKVIISGHYDSVYNDDHIIKISTSEDEVNGNEVEYISAVDIYFYRFDETVSFEDALDIIATYLPKDKIQQYFKEEVSVSEPTDTGNDTRYAKFYELKDASDSDIPQMSDSFGVMVWVDENGNATEARIDYVVYGPFDDETMDVWNYNYFAN